MKKRIVLISSISLLCLGISAFATISLNNGKIQTLGGEDYYSITINAEDVTTSTTMVSGSYVAHTDQLNNPITFNYEGIKYEQDGENKYLVFGQGAWFGNDRNSQIRKIKYARVYGDNSIFTYDYAWETKTGSILYTGDDRYSYANGENNSCNECEPNYFLLTHRDNESDAKISKIVFVYSKDCTPGSEPIFLDHITLSGQTTSLSKGSAFTFGGVVTAHYTDNSTADVTSLTTFSGYNMSARGTYTVKASYTEKGITKTATYSLAVKAWVQVWSGNASSDGTVSADLWKNVSLTGTLNIRITFSMSSSPGSGYITRYYKNNGTSWSSLTTSKPASPFTTSVNLNNSTISGILGLGVGKSSDTYSSLHCYVYWKKADKSFYITWGNSAIAGDGTISFTVTKMEAYY